MQMMQGNRRRCYRSFSGWCRRWLWPSCAAFLDESFTSTSAAVKFPSGFGQLIEPGVNPTGGLDQVLERQRSGLAHLLGGTLGM